MTGSLSDAELVVLSLILEQPQHGYQIENEITRRNMRAWTDLATSSIYYLLGKLEEKNLIAPAPDRADGASDRPRKTYQITPRGRQAWNSATLDALSRPRITYTNFLIGLHNLWNIPPGEALEAVRSYQQWLEEDLRRQREELESLGESFFPLDILFDYSFMLGEAELLFLDKLLDRLNELKASSKGSPRKNP